VAARRSAGAGVRKHARANKRARCWVSGAAKEPGEHVESEHEQAWGHATERVSNEHVHTTRHELLLIIEVIKF